MNIVKTFETIEIPNPHFISVRALLVSDSAQFEHLSLEPGQVQKNTSPIPTFTFIYLMGQAF
jgi:hypothetical protein